MDISSVIASTVSTYLHAAPTPTPIYLEFVLRRCHNTLIMSGSILKNTNDTFTVACKEMGDHPAPNVDCCDWDEVEDFLRCVILCATGRIFIEYRLRGAFPICKHYCDTIFYANAGFGTVYHFHVLFKGMRRVLRLVEKRKKRRAHDYDGNQRAHKVAKMAKIVDEIKQKRDAEAAAETAAHAAAHAAHAAAHAAASSSAEESDSNDDSN